MAHFCERIYRATGESYQAFVPSTIDGDFQFSNEVIARFTALDQTISAQQLAGFDCIEHYFKRFSAGGTALRDGRTVSRKRLALIGAQVPRMDLEARTILMHMQASEAAVAIGCEHQQFSLETFKRMAAPLKNDKGSAGQFRKGQGWIGGKTPLDAYYVCPPVEFVEPLMQGLCDFINRDDIPATLQAAIAHVQMSVIHPLSDGNGRTARALVEVILRRRKIVSCIAPPVFLYRLTLPDNDYVTAIKDFEQENHQTLYDFWHNANVWAVDKISQLQSLQGQFRRYCQAQLHDYLIERNVDLNNLVELLFNQPIVTESLLVDRLNMTFDHAIILLNVLCQCGVLQTHKLKEPKDKVIWDANKVFELIGAFDKGLFGVEC